MGGGGGGGWIPGLPDPGDIIGDIGEKTPSPIPVPTPPLVPLKPIKEAGKKLVKRAKERYLRLTSNRPLVSHVPSPGDPATKRINREIDKVNNWLMVRIYGIQYPQYRSDGLAEDIERRQAALEALEYSEQQAALLAKRQGFLTLATARKAAQDAFNSTLQMDFERFAMPATAVGQNTFIVDNVPPAWRIAAHAYGIRFFTDSEWAANPAQRLLTRGSQANSLLYYSIAGRLRSQMRQARY